MNYRHNFHAGNYADVFKHALLLKLIRAMQRKEKGFLYLDSHAGRGAYDLAAAAAGADRAPEWPEGIGRLWKEPKLPPVLDDYMTLVRGFNKGHGGGEANLRYYPGSPSIAALVRREQDRLVLWEKEDREARRLREEVAWSRATAVECGDGYKSLRAALPPVERRALVLIDPPFEDQGEAEAILEVLSEALRRFPSGVYSIWHPVTERAQAEAFHRRIRLRTGHPTLAMEMAVTADPQVRMKGCGLLVVNPPWGFAEEAQALLPALARRLAADAGGSFRCTWLVPEK